jgi:hypothetical protein
LRGLLSCTIGIHGGPRKRSKTQAGSPLSAAGNGGRGGVRSRCSRDGAAGDLSALLALRASIPPLDTPDTALRGPRVSSINLAPRRVASMAGTAFASLPGSAQRGKNRTPSSRAYLGCSVLGDSPHLATPKQQQRSSFWGMRPIAYYGKLNATTQASEALPY